MDKVKTLLLSSWKGKVLPKVLRYAFLYACLGFGLYIYAETSIVSIGLFLDRSRELGRPPWVQDAATVGLTLVAVYIGYFMFKRAHKAIQKEEKAGREKED